ncbi:macrolide ABC transporter ATP-binding protein [candidate division WWE3 bacterium RIFOXYB1_FULL_43_24]|uniref:ABC transporter, ATP-binding protein n=1 Tax=candidate division WWE3 bacterium GW2011_GWF1_42_14 TaxID=1619138 RepID=A0A0G0YRH0_UNCKA|nr:MAG: ABC transporter, ATP-binding protein [candidate division WWE3 bacterium GW2011_GWA1_42_12]KKS34078.1 MAG: ABC transporter, ATP-binding protein [candidate division WWE3 bacterium GW2011_GWD1_42_14]KKS39252.1 MAG: ABC transporter, ATP-binding protein [candidate division WWE3 bacterium GW2011_GWF1_42_14]KKS40750.1 MAG: ABC transporter, ATP-binding protein [candidate division WWE3 bacterium GW2011_GWE1_42_16]OGC59478.1 MAG: macrolide ABC transporter ATP-binding protein [candidate division W
MTPVLQAQNVSKIYDMGTSKIEALKGVNIGINKGEFVAIVGKSGSGKSTLMHILGLLDTPTEGEIILNGVNTKGMSEKQLAAVRNSEIGFVFQTFNLLQRTTVLDNVILPLKYSDVPSTEWVRKAKEMIELVGLQDRLKNKSNELSGGQKQRVAIARAMINDPSIILADEPTGNLDSKTGDEIVNNFLRLNSRGKTIILVTHDNDLAQIAQRRIVLKDGSIVE